MDFSQVKNITIPEGDVTKIEKDGVVLWQSGYQPILYPTKPLYLHKNDNNTYSWVGWNNSKYNYGSNPTQFGTTNFPMINVAAWNSQCLLCGASGNGQAIKLVYPRAWTGQTINNLLFYTYNKSSTRVILRSGDRSQAFSSEVTITAITGDAKLVTVPLNATAKAYFAADHPEGVSIILEQTYYRDSDQTATSIQPNSNTEELGVIWFN